MVFDREACHKQFYLPCDKTTSKTVSIVFFFASFLKDRMGRNCSELLELRTRGFPLCGAPQPQLSRAVAGGKNFQRSPTCIQQKSNLYSPTLCFSCGFWSACLQILAKILLKWHEQMGQMRLLLLQAPCRFRPHSFSHGVDGAVPIFVLFSQAVRMWTSKVQAEMPSSRNDIKQAPLRPGIVSEGPLPKGTRLGPRFRFEPTQSNRNKLKPIRLA